MRRARERCWPVYREGAFKFGYGPVFVKTKYGHVAFDLKADDFLLTDNGVSQHLSLEQDTDLQPLALAIVVKTGGAGAQAISLTTKH